MNKHSHTRINKKIITRFHVHMRNTCTHAYALIYIYVYYISYEKLYICNIEYTYNRMYIFIYFPQYISIFAERNSEKILVLFIFSKYIILVLSRSRPSFLPLPAPSLSLTHSLYKYITRMVYVAKSHSSYLILIILFLSFSYYMYHFVYITLMIFFCKNLHNNTFMCATNDSNKFDERQRWTLKK